MVIDFLSLNPALPPTYCKMGTIIILECHGTVEKTQWIDIYEALKVLPGMDPASCMHVRVPALWMLSIHPLAHLTSPPASEKRVSSTLSTSQLNLHLSSSSPSKALRLNETQAHPGFALVHLHIPAYHLTGALLTDSRPPHLSNE